MLLNELKCISENIDIDKYIEYREIIKKQMEHPDWLGDFSKEDLINMLDNSSKIWNYYYNDEFVCSMMLIPATEKSCNKFGLKIDYKKVVDYGPMFVNPKYRGNSLQYQMLQELDNYCKEKGYVYAAGTIHPDNIYSIINLEKDNFVKTGTKSFKRGIRNLYLKCFDESIEKKILSFIVCDKEILLLKGDYTDPQFHESFWYPVTGSVEDYDDSLESAVKREIKEETNLDVISLEKLPLVFEYESLGKMCLEYSYISRVKKGEITLDFENIDYKWCDLSECMDIIKWHYDKKELEETLNKIISSGY